jgi:hypothetical protein
MKGALNAPDRKRPLPPRMGETEGIRLKGRLCEILAGMKGWRPFAWLKLETGSGSFQADAFLPDIGSIALSFPRVPGLFALWTPGFPFSRPRARGRQVGRKWRPSVSQRRVHDRKMAPALRLLHETGGTGNEDKRNDRQPVGNNACASVARQRRISESGEFWHKPLKDKANQF